MACKTDKSLPPSEMLYGLDAIATTLGMKPRAVGYRIATGEIPGFRLGKVICVRRETLTAWLQEMERTGGSLEKPSPDETASGQ